MDPQASLTRAFGHSDSADGLYDAFTHRGAVSPFKRCLSIFTLTPSTIELVAHPEESPKPSPKEKVTLRISTALIAEYRDWSWEARMQLSRLVERALLHFREQHRSTLSAA